MTSDNLESIRYWAYHQLSKQTFHSSKTMNPEELKEMARMQVYDALHDVPLMFQLSACKQVMDVAGTDYSLAKRNKEEHDQCCLSRGQEIQTCSHILQCNEADRVGAMKRFIGSLDNLLQSVGTEPTL